MHNFLIRQHLPHHFAQLERLVSSLSFMTAEIALERRVLPAMPPSLGRALPEGDRRNITKPATVKPSLMAPLILKDFRA
jgi:hypothetical protein